MDLNEDSLRKLIREEIESSVKDRFKPILTKLDGIQSVIDLISSNMDSDRKDFAEIQTNQAQMLQLSKEILDISANQTKRIADKVSEKAQEAVDASAQAVANNVEPVMANAINKMKKGIPLNKSNWWSKLFFWKSK